MDKLEKDFEDIYYPAIRMGMVNFHFRNEDLEDLFCDTVLEILIELSKGNEVTAGLASMKAKSNCVDFLRNFNNSKVDIRPTEFLDRFEY